MPTLTRRVGEYRVVSRWPKRRASTVLEQDHFYSAFLCSHVTALTNSQYRDDELSWWSTGNLRSGLVVCSADEPSVWSSDGHKWLSDFWRDTESLGFDPPKKWEEPDLNLWSKRLAAKRVLARRFTLSQNGYGERMTYGPGMWFGSVAPEDGLGGSAQRRAFLCE